MTPKRRNTRHDELPEVSTLSFERFGALADDLVSFYRGQDRKSIWTTGYDFVASEIRPRSFDSSIALLFQGEDGSEVEILIPFRTVAAVDALPEAERLGGTVDELALLVMEDLVGSTAEELGSQHVVEFEIGG